MKTVQFKDNEIGKRIKWLRWKNGKTQSEFAKSVGVNVKTVVSWERGYTQPDFFDLLLIADVYGVTYDWLTNGM